MTDSIPRPPLPRLAVFGIGLLSTLVVCGAVVGVLYYTGVIPSFFATQTATTATQPPPNFGQVNPELGKMIYTNRIGAMALQGQISRSAYDQLVQSLSDDKARWVKLSDELAEGKALWSVAREAGSPSARVAALEKITSGAWYVPK
jgi:hypothetical protein